MICHKCKEENRDDANFCKSCGEKLKESCHCWVNKKDNYNCGESSCPGYGLFRLIKAEGTNC